MTGYTVGSEKCAKAKARLPHACHIDVHEADGTRGARQARQESASRGGAWPMVCDNNGSWYEFE